MNILLIDFTFFIAINTGAATISNISCDEEFHPYCPLLEKNAECVLLTGHCFWKDVLLLNHLNVMSFTDDLQCNFTV